MVSKKKLAILIGASLGVTSAVAQDWTSETNDRCVDSSPVTVLFVPPGETASQAEIDAVPAVEQNEVVDDGYVAPSSGEGWTMDQLANALSPGSVATPVVAADDAPQVDQNCYEIYAGQSVAEAVQSWEDGSWGVSWEFDGDVYAPAYNCVRGPYEMAVKTVVYALRKGGGLNIKVEESREDLPVPLPRITDA